MFNEIYQWLSTQIQTNQFFGAATFGAVIASLFAVLKGVPFMIWERIRSIITYRVTINQNSGVYNFITSWLMENHPDKARNIEINGYYRDDKSTSLSKLPISDYFFKFIYGRLIRISFHREELKGAQFTYAMYNRSYVFSGIFAKKVIERLLSEIVDKYKKNKTDSIFHKTERENFKYVQTIRGKKVSEIIINKDLKREIINDIKSWLDSKEDYERRGITHKRGHVYYGPPGTGKTSIVKAISMEFLLDIYNINLSSIKGDEELSDILSKIPDNSILLIEDIDSFFDGREIKNEKSDITFSGFINSLDGAIGLNSALIIFTTNHIEKLDPALIRPGRIDFIREIGYASNDEVNEYLSMFYEKEIEIPFKVKIPMCEVQNACLSEPNDMNKAIEKIEKCSKYSNKPKELEIV